MSNNAIATTPSSKTLEWFEQVIPIRGCKLSFEIIGDIYRELSRINTEFGQKLVASLEKDPEMTAEEWAKYKENLLDDAFRLTISITGDGDQRIYAESVDGFSSDNLPKQIKRIYFTNITAYKRNANRVEPANKIQVTLDFGKPVLLDPNHFVSSATPNESQVKISGDDISFVRAMQQVIKSKLTNQRTWYGVIHKNFAYDLGLWVFALPLALFFASYYADTFLPENSKWGPYKWAFFIYSTGMMLLAYRFLISYAQWAFPVNILAENKDTAWKHRLVLAGALSWFGYKAVDIIYGLIVPI